MLPIFRAEFAVYMNESAVRLGLTFKEISAASGVPPTTVSNYARAKVDEPNNDYCERIAAVFGDGPEVVQAMRKRSLPATAAANELIAKSGDKDRMEQMAAVMREQMVKMLAEYGEQTAAQQTEIIQHADQRVEQERELYKERLQSISDQYKAELASMREQSAEKIGMLRERAEIIAGERDRTCGKCAAAHDRATGYLRRTIRILSVAIALLVVISVVSLSALGGYAAYAYLTFDREDPTRGLYQRDVTPEPAAASPIG